MMAGHDPERHNVTSASAEFDAPVAALRPSSQTMLSTMLNPIKIIPTENGLPRDWRGLAELAGISSEIISFLHTKQDPMAQLIQQWYKSPESQCKSFSDLKAFLAVIDRFDVVDDIHPLLASDAEAYKVAQNSQSIVTAQMNPAYDNSIITIEDSERIHKNLPLTRYDAFILFADEDSEFAGQVIEKLEQEYKLKLCVKDRDLLPGIMFENEVIGRLIEERCNRFLVILSPNFLKSSANNFLISYAQASALESRARKIVPCVYEECQLPPSIRYAFSIKYRRSGTLYNFWDKLSQSIRTPRSDVATSTSPPSQKEKFVGPLSDDDAKWWDAEKKVPKDPSSDSPPPSYNDVSKSKINGSISTNSDTFSINSNTHLLSSEKKKKWYKFKNPIKGKNKQKALVENKQAIPE